MLITITHREPQTKHKTVYSQRTSIITDLSAMLMKAATKKLEPSGTLHEERAMFTTS